ncbi:alkaline phosphatase family protein [Acidiplasma sp.]|jgi:predicted AlkP superfamily pyrophosphatase or phosphodiesterase|uniref:alkaline phosphatase family protein n=1 Tax=Acidiplasma TaxID=507753 RepID=UPI00258731B6|nr:alkaline phosphatase family protein [Acidiplasma sp.]
MIIDNIIENYKKDENFVYPCYNGYNFANINASILNLFGISHGRGLDRNLYFNLDNDVPTVFIYIDGLGYGHWIDYLSQYRPFKIINDAGLVSPITAVFPSTTAAASNTINTGKYPSEHGLFEWRLYIDEFSMVLKSLPFIPVYKKDNERFKNSNFSPEILFNGETFYEILRKSGIKSYIISNSNLMKSDYSRIMYSGSKERKRFDFLCEGFIILKKLLMKLHGPSYVFFYIENFDKMQHRYGPGSLEHLYSIKNISYLFNDFLNELAGQKINVIISSDHGFMPVKNKIYVRGIDEYITVRDGKKIPETWSPRDMSIYSEDDKIMDVLSEQLMGRAMIIKKGDLIRRQLLGPADITKKYCSRIGDFIVLPYYGNTVWYKYCENDIIKDNGMHGGLSPEEMIIPLASINLKDIKNY